MRTSFSVGYFPDHDNPDEFFSAVKESGIQGIDFNFDIYLTGDKIKSGEFTPLYNSSLQEMYEFFRPIKESAEKFGIAVVQAHAPFQAYVDERDDINERCYDALEKTYAMTAYLGAKYIVVHPINVAYTKGREYEENVNIEYYKRMIPAAKKYGVVVLLENMFSSISRVVSEAVCSDFYQAVRMIDTLNEYAGCELFGFCYDVGHATLLGKNQRASVNVLGRRIKALHIHDNDNVQDLHALPYTHTRNWGGNLVTDWDGFIEGLRDIGYNGDVNFECTTGLSRLPAMVRVAAFAYLNAIGRYIISRLQ